MSKIGIRSNAVKTISYIYTESKIIVQIDRRIFGKFWTHRKEVCSLDTKNKEERFWNQFVRVF